jgi:phenylpyruvate tautomerase PptA (4-oxalocrotonate tautomerase family)
MPIITLSMYAGKSAEVKHTLCMDIKNTIKKSFDITHDNFHFRINEYNKTDLLIPESSTDKYLSIEVQLIQIRSIPEKEKLYKLMSESLNKHGIQPNDLVIILTFPPAENWYIRGLTGIEINKPKN